MKLLTALATFLLLTTLFSCKKEQIAKGTPPCIKAKIESFSRECCSKGRVEEYTFQGQSVYVFDPGNCGADMTSEVVSETCSSLGYLGGIAGNHQINGQDFNSAIFVRTTWRK